MLMYVDIHYVTLSVWHALCFCGVYARAEPSSLVPPLSRCLCPLLRHGLTQTQLHFIITAIIIIVIANNRANAAGPALLSQDYRHQSNDDQRQRRAHATRLKRTGINTASF